MLSPISIRNAGIAFGTTLGAALLLIAGSVQGEPRMALSEDVWDFGNITATYPVSHVFKVKNTGDQPLVIEQVTAGCGCTTTALGQHTINPGNEVPLGLTFNSATLAPGTSAEKTVTITCNDPQAPSKVVSIRAGLSYQGVTGIGIEPKWVQLEKREWKRAVWKKVILTNQFAGPIEVQVLDVAGAVTLGKLTQTRIPSNGRAELRLLVNGPKLAGARSTLPSVGNSVTLAITTERRRERVTLPVAASTERTKTQAVLGDHSSREKD